MCIPEDNGAAGEWFPRWARVDAGANRVCSPSRVATRAVASVSISPRGPVPWPSDLQFDASPRELMLGMRRGRRRRRQGDRGRAPGGPRRDKTTGLARTPAIAEAGTTAGCWGMRDGIRENGHVVLESCRSAATPAPCSAFAVSVSPAVMGEFRRPPGGHGDVRKRTASLSEHKSASCSRRHGSATGTRPDASRLAWALLRSVSSRSHWTRLP